MDQDPPDKGTVIGRWPWIALRLRCHVCRRQSDVRITACVVKYGYGAPVHHVLRSFMSACPWDPYSQLRKPQKYSHRCGAYICDLGSTRPPDLPPSMKGLSVIEGGAAGLLPAEPAPAERRRRVGGDDR